MARNRYVETVPVRTRLRKGDVVEVMSGKEKGKRGPIVDIDAGRARVLVEGVNFVHKHTKPSQQNQQGGIIQMEAYLPISNVMAIDPESDKPTRIGIRRDENGGRVRIAKRSGKSLDSK